MQDIIERFELQNGRPYQSASEHREDLLELLDLLLALEENQRPSSQEHTVENQPAIPTDMAARMWKCIQQRQDITQIYLPLCYLQEKLGLSDYGLFCVILAAATGFYTDYPTIFGKISGYDGATPGLAEALFSRLAEVTPEDVMEIFADAYAGRLLFALDEKDNLPYKSAELVPSHLLFPVLEGAWHLKDWLPGAELFYPDDVTEMPNTHHIGQIELLERMMNRALLKMETAPCLHLLKGAEGCGKRSALRQAAVQAGLALVIADVESLKKQSGKTGSQIGNGLLLQAILVEGAVVLSGLSESMEPVPAITALLSDSVRFDIPVFLTVTDGIPAWLPLGENTVEVYFEPDSLLERHTLWKELTAEYGLSPEVDVSMLANKLHYTAGSIRKVLSRAVIHAEMNGRDIVTADDIGAGITLHNAGEIKSKSIQRIPPVFTWDDLVLPEPQIELLHDACNRIVNSHMVLDSWGFYKKLPYGRGLSMLLYGPPGTGKTMSAQVIAGHLGLELYRVDVSQLISKYIGETQKNLAEVFAFAERCNGVLLFDEADALFSSRTEVKDSHDRHANTEIAYLLQRMEEYNGLSLLATNLFANLDAAFRRRFTYIVNIPLPNGEMRLRLWEKAFPTETPLSTGLSFERLAAELTLSGSAIKSIAVDAAYRAAAQRQPVGREHIERAVILEMQKQGILMGRSDMLSLW